MLPNSFLASKLKMEGRYFYGMIFGISCRSAGCLTDKYGFRISYDAAGCAIGPKLSTIIGDGEWNWPSARSYKLVEIQSRLPEVVLGNEDLPVWKSSKGVYNCAETWEHLRVKYTVVKYWHKYTWFSLAIPRRSLILWLVFRDALTTKEMMCLWGFEGSRTLCLFCHGRQENRGHLFFNYSFSRRIWRTVMFDFA